MIIVTMNTHKTSVGALKSPQSAKVLTPPITPTLLSTEAHQLFEELRIIHQRLSECESLSPGELVNGLLTGLVKLCIEPYSTEFATHFLNIEGIGTLCSSLQSICAHAEGQLEEYWAVRILETQNADSMCTMKIARIVRRAEINCIAVSNLSTHRVLHRFPYYTNYIDLSRLESNLLSAFLPSPQATTTNIAFIGSGPLPLSSICLLDNMPKAKIVNIDRDAQALGLSKKLVEYLCIPPDRMSFILEDVEESLATNGSPHPTRDAIAWNSLDVVFLAALVGMGSAAKVPILASLARRLKPGALILARSARGLRTVLYPVSRRKRLFTHDDNGEDDANSVCACLGSGAGRGYFKVWVRRAR
ncbi:unnamed protein product [Periconia digitata]|uniref:Nicotianamine synthase n=1 Tax=Periconia digitata TaxID=1303443 RepID=A0A9W4XN35_9PLEO|nr:unnamed protein product [Periconia digitata]